MDCDGCDSSSVAVELHIGWMATPRLALAYDLVESVKLHGFGATSFMIHAAAAQYWLTPRFWLKGGAGPALFDDTGDFGFMETQETGFGVHTAAGFELYDTHRFVFEAELQLAAGFFSETDRVVNTALQLGVSWY